MRRPDYTKKTQSDKIEVNRHKMYRVNDPLQFAYLFYPAKNAAHRRAAFLAIFFEIKNAPKQRVEHFEYIAQKYGLSQSTVTKARVKMSRLGLIIKQNEGWQFSSVFRNTLEKLIEHVERFKAQVEKPSQIQGEYMYIDIAKSENTKKSKEPKESFMFGPDNSWMSKDKRDR